MVGDGEDVLVAPAAEIHQHNAALSHRARDLADAGQRVGRFQRRDDAFEFAAKLEGIRDLVQAERQSAGCASTPSGGSVYLVGPAVENSGLINAPNGEVILAAGQTVGLIDTGTPGVKVEITGREGNVTNLGTIASEAGRIGIAGVLVKNSGTLNASSVVSEGGRIFLQATKKIELDNSSVIAVDGIKGGSVVAKVEDAGQLSGEMVAGGRISAQGDGTRGSGGFVETSGKWADINNVSVATGGGTASSGST